MLSQLLVEQSLSLILFLNLEHNTSTFFTIFVEIMNVKPEDWAAQVLKVRVVCHTAGRVPNTKASDNHWSIFLIIGENRSVQYNMTAEAGYIDGNLKVTSYGYIESRSTLRYWDFEAISFFTISMVHNLPVTQRRFDQYDISGGGSGCRWWV